MGRKRPIMANQLENAVKNEVETGLIVVHRVWGCQKLEAPFLGVPVFSRIIVY